VITHAQAPSASSSLGHLGGATLACTELVQSKSRGALGRRFCSGRSRAYTRKHTRTHTATHTNSAYTQTHTATRKSKGAHTHTHNQRYSGARAHLVHNWFGVSPVARLTCRVVRAMPCSRDLRQMHPRHLHGKMSPFNTRAHSAKTLSRKKRAICIHAHMIAMRSVLRQHRSTCTNIRPQQTQTRLRIYRIAQCHAREARIKIRLAPAREYTHCVHVCLSRYLVYLSRLTVCLRQVLEETPHHSPALEYLRALARDR
jgi:hypothetical protein